VHNDRELSRDGDLGLTEPFRLTSFMPQAFSADHSIRRASSDQEALVLM
jgi:hypothetical protein